VARTALQLSDPGIARVHDFGEVALPGELAVPYLVRELVSGQTLDQRLGQGPLTARDALRIVAAVAGALAVAHRAGVAHGHVVPANIVLGREEVLGGEELKITDFGLSALRHRAGPETFRGVLSYVAPELAGGGPATPAADVYALGVVFVACLAGITSPDGMSAGAGLGAAGLGAAGLGAAGLGAAGLEAAGLEAAGLEAAGETDGSDGAAPLDILPLESVPAGLAALWASCLGPDPLERPTAAHAAEVSRELLPEPGPVPERGPVTGRGPAFDRGPALDPAGGDGSLGPAGPRHRRLAGSRRRRMIATGGVVTVAAAVAVAAGLLAPGQHGDPASSATAALTRTAAAAAPSPSVTGPAPSPEATSSILTSTPAHLLPLTAIRQLSQTIGNDVATGQMRQDVGVDLDNLIAPVQTELAAGEKASVVQLADTISAKLRTRVSEGAVSGPAASVLNGELNALRQSAGNGG
jgi:hypothetical protein